MINAFWQLMTQEVRETHDNDPVIALYLTANVLQHQTFEQAFSHLLASKLQDAELPAAMIKLLIEECCAADPSICESAIKDLKATRERDPVCHHFSTPFLYFKGFHALGAYRIAHYLWKQKREHLALFIQSRMSSVFSVDIHPAAVIGSGLLVDHATGIVIGETAEVQDNVSILHSVTLGGTGKECGDRHPKIGKGVLISAGAKILGNVTIGDGAKIAAGSVVLKSVPPHTTVAGVPAKIIGQPKTPAPALGMNHFLE